MENKITLFNQFNIYQNIFPKDINNRKIDIYKFKNSKITGLNLYYPNVLLNTENSLVLPVLERTMSLQSGTIYEKYDMKFEYSYHSVKNIVMEPLFFFHL